MRPTPLSTLASIAAGNGMLMRGRSILLSYATDYKTNSDIRIGRSASHLSPGESRRRHGRKASWEKVATHTFSVASLLQFGFSQSRSDHSVCILRDNDLDEQLILGYYVDDLGLFPREESNRRGGAVNPLTIMRLE
eukprot:4399302-Pleurochrysis_carterae.AAC.1